MFCGGKSTTQNQGKRDKIVRYHNSACDFIVSYVEQDQWLRNGLWLEGGLYERPGGVNHEDLFTALRQEFDDDSVSLVIADSQKLFEKDWIVAEFHFLVWLDAPKELSWQRRIHKRWKGRKWIHECKRNYFYVHVWPHHIAVYKQSVFKHFGRRIDLNIPAEDSINSFTRTGGRENPCDAAARAGSARPIDDAVAEAAAAIGEEASIGFSDLRRAAIAGTSSGGRQRRQRPKLQQQKQHTRGTDAEAQTAAAAEVGPAAVMHCEPLQLKLAATTSAARAAASLPHACTSVAPFDRGLLRLQGHVVVGSIYPRHPVARGRHSVLRVGQWKQGQERYYVERRREDHNQSVPTYNFHTKTQLNLDTGKIRLFRIVWIEAPPAKL